MIVPLQGLQAPHFTLFGFTLYITESILDSVEVAAIHFLRNLLP